MGEGNMFLKANFTSALDVLTFNSGKDLMVKTAAAQYQDLVKRIETAIMKGDVSSIGDFQAQIAEVSEQLMSLAANVQAAAEFTRQQQQASETPAQS